MNKNKSKGNYSKIYIGFILVLLILIGLFLINFIKGNSKAEYTSKVVKGNISLITNYDFSTVKSVEARIRELEDKESMGNFDPNKKITKEQYMQIFNNSAVIGDSITEGLTAYGYLGENQVFCGIGASIMHGDKLFQSAASTYPSFAFFSFGMNDMGNYSGHADSFVSKYSMLINDFKKTSPNTIIFVNGISTPSKSAIKKNSILKNYKKFNNALKSMCKEQHVKFIDNSFILEAHPDYYAGDGIHVVSDYYPLWLNNMILKAGL